MAWLGAQPRRRKPAFVTHDNEASLCGLSIGLWVQKKLFKFVGPCTVKLCSVSCGLIFELFAVYGLVSVYA